MLGKEIKVSVAYNNVQSQQEMHVESIDRQTSILWVDDNPTNNSYEIAHLEDMGINITTATTTEEGLSLFQSGKYDRVISDMGRKERTSFRGKAGIDITKMIREINKDIPIIIYCSSSTAVRMRDEAIKAGANEITASTATLMRSLKLESLSNMC